MEQTNCQCKDQHNPERDHSQLRGGVGAGGGDSEGLKCMNFGKLMMDNVRKKANSSKDDSSVSEDMDIDIIPDTKEGLPAALRQAGHEFFLRCPQSVVPGASKGSYFE